MGVVIGQPVEGASPPSFFLESAAKFSLDDARCRCIE